MYGTQDASNIWQEDYSELLATGGYKRRVSNGSVFYCEEDDSRVSVHGDDFMVLGDQEAIDRFEKLL